MTPRQNSEPADFGVVLEQEMGAIAERRDANDERPQSREAIKQSLVGLALSGGGIRSACVSLGVLQAIARRGVLRFFDYMSTVSGGGYAGAYLDAMMIKRMRRQQSEDSPSSSETPGHAFDNEASVDTLHSDWGNPHGVQRIIFGDRYLLRPVQFFNRYLIGLALMLILMISGLVMLCALGAWIIRVISHTQSRWTLAALGFSGDMELALFPTLVLFVLWMLAWFLSYFREAHRARGRLARWLLVLLLVSGAGSLASLVGTGDIHISTSLTSSQGDASAVEETANKFSSNLHVVLFSMIIAGLLPYLSPKALFRSGVAPKNMLDRATFWFASRALLIGLPFILVTYFATENRSGFNEHRVASLTRPELTDWNRYRGGYSRFWHVLELLDAEKPEQTVSPVPVTTVRGGPPVLFSRTKKTAPETEAGKSFMDLVLRDGTPPIEVARRGDKESKTYLHFEESSSELGWTTVLKDEPPDENLDLYAAPKSLKRLDDLSKRLVELEDELGGGRSWVSMATLWWTRLVGGDALGNDFRQYYIYRRDEDRLRSYLVQRVNQALFQPDLYQQISAIYPRIAGANKKASVWNFFSLVPEEVSDAEKQWNDTVLMAIDDAHRATEIYERHLEHEGKNGPSFRRLVRANRRLLAACFNRPGREAIRPESTIYSYVVLDADQQLRWNWFRGAGAIFVLSLIFINLNATSLHGYYAEEIDRKWIDDGGMPQLNVPLDELRTTKVGGPYHLINCMWHLMGDNKENFIGKRSREYFVLSQLYCGSHTSGFAKTDHYMGRQLNLADAVAISGAAVSPMSVTQLLGRLLLVLVNFRLGQWLAHPRTPSHSGLMGRAIGSHFFFSPLDFLLHMIRPDKRRCFVSDGGLFENLGVEQLLHRRCKLIIAVDAGQDPKYKFADFARLQKWAQAVHGIRFSEINKAEADATMTDLIPGGKRTELHRDKLSESHPGPGFQWSDKHWVAFRIHYPETTDSPRDGMLIMIKPSLDGDEPESIVEHRLTHQNFPHDETSNQFYTPEVVEAYRSLGEHMAADLLRKISPDSIEPSGTQDFIDLVAARLSPESDWFRMEDVSLTWPDLETLVLSEEELKLVPAPDVVEALLQFHEQHHDDEAVAFLRDQLEFHAERSAEALRVLIVQGLASATSLPVVETSLEALAEMEEKAEPQCRARLLEILDGPGRAPVKKMIRELFPELVKDEKQESRRTRTRDS